IKQIKIKIDYAFNWEDVQILDRELFLSKKFISEMLYIKRQKNGLN
ncbi:hypothetical protein EAG_02154, partial [Camponotus floridanus]